jgi:hypothetical protein
MLTFEIPHSLFRRREADQYLGLKCLDDCYLTRLLISLSLECLSAAVDIPTRGYVDADDWQSRGAKVC